MQNLQLQITEGVTGTVNYAEVVTVPWFHFNWINLNLLDFPFTNFYGLYCSSDCISTLSKKMEV